MNISCDVVKDLLMQYADGTLSEASEIIVRDHIGECEGCRKYLEEIKGICTELDENAGGQPEDIGVLKRIRRSIFRKRIITAFVSVAVIVLIIIAGNLYASLHLSYIPYENTGIICTDNEIRTSDNYAQLIAIGTEYQGENVEFMFLCSSPASRHSGSEKTIIISDFSQSSGTNIDDDGHKTTEYVDKVYYLPEAAINKLPFIFNPHYSPVDLMDIDYDEVIPKLIKQSALIWARDSQP